MGNDFRYPIEVGNRKGIVSRTRRGRHLTCSCLSLWLSVTGLVQYLDVTITVALVLTVALDPAVRFRGGCKKA